MDSATAAFLATPGVVERKLRMYRTSRTAYIVKRDCHRLGYVVLHDDGRWRYIEKPERWLIRGAGDDAPGLALSNAPAYMSATAAALALAGIEPVDGDA